MQSSNLALRMDVAELADEAPQAGRYEASPRVAALARRRTRFDYRAFDERAFDQRSIVIGAPGFRPFRVR